MQTDQFNTTKTEEVKEERDDLKEKASDLFEHTADLAQTFYKLTVLKAAEKSTNVLSSLISVVALCTVGVLGFFFASMALAFWVGEMVESTAGGFGIVAGFYLLITVIIVAMRKKIVFPYIRNRIIRKLYD